MRRLVLYSRPGCHLCDLARDGLQAMRAEAEPFALSEIDIDRDDALLAAYLERIPVVEIDGEIVSELELDAGAVRRALGLNGA